MSKRKDSVPADRPKKNLTPFFQFRMDKLPEVKGKPNGMKLVKMMWDKLDPKAKAGYEEKYQKGKEKYTKDLEAWKQTHGEAEMQRERSSRKVANGEKAMGAKPKKAGKAEEPERKASKSKGNGDKARK